MFMETVLASCVCVCIIVSHLPVPLNNKPISHFHLYKSYPWSNMHFTQCCFDEALFNLNSKAFCLHYETCRISFSLSISIQFSCFSPKWHTPWRQSVLLICTLTFYLLNLLKWIEHMSLYQLFLHNKPPPNQCSQHNSSHLLKAMRKGIVATEPSTTEFLLSASLKLLHILPLLAQPLLLSFSSFMRHQVQVAAENMYQAWELEDVWNGNNHSSSRIQCLAEHILEMSNSSLFCCSITCDLELGIINY